MKAVIVAMRQFPGWKRAQAQAELCASGYKGLCDISSVQRSVLWSVSSALSRLHQTVSSKAQYLAHKLPQVSQGKK